MPFNPKYGKKRGGFRGGRGGRHSNNSNSQNRRPKSEYRHQDQLTEEEVGITEYVNDLEGFPAVIKARYSDFQVNEIDLDGNIAKFTNKTVPKCFIEQESFSYENVNESPLDKISQETWDALKELVKSSDGVPVTIDSENFSKDERKMVHECVKKHFGKEIVASTITKDEKSILEFRKYNKQEKDTRQHWPDGIPEFVHFILYKECMDTMEATLRISRNLRMSPKKITYAGVKDRRAKTSQWFCIQKIDPTNLIKKTSNIRNLHIGNIEFKEKGLKLGDLKGNRFRIALRNVKAEDDLINNSIEFVKTHGFLNYYGLQRFGNDKDAPTFLIGIKLLTGQWKEAVNLILKVKSGDDPYLDINKAKKKYAETKDAAAALELCRHERNVSFEKKLLQGLAANTDNDFVNSLESIPRNMRLMYIHSFQSLVWNKMTSKRIHEFGLKPVEGDLVFVDSSQVDEPVIENDENSDGEEKEESLITEEKVERERPAVRPLKADELDKYTITDIVLPLPGYDVVYPENMKPFYKEVLEEYGLTLEMPKQKVRSYTLSGAYRKICHKVQDLEWKIMKYNDPTDNLILSDFEEMMGKEEPVSMENGIYKAVVVSFTLNSSSYATMVLREILRCNTSTSFQAGLNDYAAKTEKSFDINDVEPGSLLADKEKYEDFKNNLFKDILGGDKEKSGSGKRELENEENDVDKKKVKVVLGDEKESGLSKRDLENEEENDVDKKKVKVVLGDEEESGLSKRDLENEEENDGDKKKVKVVLGDKEKSSSKRELENEEESDDKDKKKLKVVLGDKEESGSSKRELENEEESDMDKKKLKVDEA